MRVELLQELVEAEGPSGREASVRAIVERELAPLCDRLESDPLGGLAGVRGNGAPRLALAAHMDEIGLMVTHVEDSGFLRFATLGGWDPRTLVSQRVVVHGRERLPGIVGLRPVHLLEQSERTKAPKTDALAIDIGLSGERAKELVRRGDVVTREKRLVPVGDLLTAPSIDDRVGILVMIEALAAAEPGSEVWAIATAQEEVGLRGARVATSRIEPDVALAIDTCVADDGPGGTPSRSAKVGGGAAIRVMDASAIANTRLVNLLISIAEEREIPHQLYVAARGGTDTGELQRSGTGAIAGCVSIPARYGHSSIEACHPDDVDATIALVAGLVEKVGELSPA